MEQPFGPYVFEEYPLASLIMAIVLVWINFGLIVREHVRKKPVSTAVVLHVAGLSVLLSAVVLMFISWLW